MPSAALLQYCSTRLFSVIEFFFEGAWVYYFIVLFKEENITVPQSEIEGKSYKCHIPITLLI